MYSYRQKLSKYVQERVDFDLITFFRSCRFLISGSSMNKFQVHATHYRMPRTLTLATVIAVSRHVEKRLVL